MGGKVGRHCRQSSIGRGSVSNALSFQAVAGLISSLAVDHEIALSLLHVDVRRRHPNGRGSVYEDTFYLQGPRIFGVYVG